MSLLYYNSIFKNEGKARAVYNAANNNFNMFKEYLDIAIQTQKSKSISISWEAAEEAEVSSMNWLVNCFKYELNSNLQFKIPSNIYLIRTNDNIKLELLDKNKIMVFTDVSPIKITLEKDQFIYIKQVGYYIFLDNELPKNRITTTINNNCIITLDEINANDITIENITQHDNAEFKPLNLTVNNDLVTVNFEGDLNIKESIYVCGIPIMDYYLIDENTYAPIELKNGQKISIIDQNLNTIFSRDKIDDNTELFINGVRIKHKTIKINKPNSILYKGEWHNLIYEGTKTKISYNNTLDLNKKIIVCDENGYELEIVVRRNKENAESVLIRLIDDENDDDDMVASFSKIDYFFDEGVNTVDNGKPRNKKLEYKEFKIRKKYREENLLELEPIRRHATININDLPSKLFLPVNTYQLEKQRRAIQNIKFTPLFEHKGLLSLVEKKEDNHAWQNFNYTDINDWYILNDETRNGTLAQREFVKGSLNTTDFMLLEGPPGSGKTTAIVELIIQLIKRKKRILLSASTHVAIDNVIERLKDNDGNLIQGLMPIRIGDPNNVSNEVLPYLLNNIIDSNNQKFEEVILSSANLVCGTTIGILQHPVFKRNLDEILIPEFDYLIIDESSKTTFQEFLVPALYAKKWILVGDIKQLSPFTDREYIEANLSEFTVDNGKSRVNIFKEHQQNAALLLYKFLEKQNLENNYKNFMSQKVKIEVLKELILEIRERSKSNFNRYSNKLKYIGFIVDDNFEIKEDENDNFFIINKSKIITGSYESWIISGLSLIFIDSKVYEEVIEYIPSNKIQLGLKNWEDSKEYYKSNAYYFRNKKNIEIREKGKSICSVKEIIKNTNDFLQTKSWSGEIAWRIIRIYELRLSKKETSLDKDIELLLPSINKEKIMQKIDVVQNIALPSTLESLQRGVPSKREFKFNSVLNSGFNKEDIRKRHIILDFQHRMHSEISVFPREQFYNSKALKDSNRIIYEREWDYKRYKARNIWIDVEGTTSRNYNLAEVKQLMKELKEFVKWAKGKENKWTVACLTFYKGQERKIREELRIYCNQKNRSQNFEKDGIQISLYTIDKFQGREADITFISMVQTYRDGFLDSPNRLNVAITRARFQRVIIGKRSYFNTKSNSNELKNLALNEVLFIKED